MITKAITEGLNYTKKAKKKIVLHSCSVETVVNHVGICTWEELLVRYDLKTKEKNSLKYKEKNNLKYKCFATVFINRIDL